ncbi:Ig-like domain-containing protein [Raineya orbicola]|jgi:gliding motility-associated-like protein|uniref:Gliding motility-associated C-terminal domain n=1 Tax=Raineya orbicola TaxID=2016530 RepID=A0A2N3ICH9_9BACT|nr:Ig-like domain-containing protein [Raineya orbicola]PKQ68031.1 Gliding motility-associated C-terminal domain [Raineya orbicola]
MRKYFLLFLLLLEGIIAKSLPTDTLLFPARNATLVPNNVRLRIYFNENMQKGLSGSVKIFDAASNNQIFFIPITCTCITVSGNWAEIIMPASLSFNQVVYVIIATGTFKNMVGEEFAGFDDAFDWRFSIANGLVSHQSFNPTNATQCLSLQQNTFQIAFSAPVMAVPSGKIRIFEKATNILHEQIPVQSSRVLISGQVVSFLLNQPLSPFREYYITIEPASFKTSAGAVYEGIYDNFVWSFRTTLAKPSVAQTNLAVCVNSSVFLRVTHPTATQFRWYRGNNPNPITNPIGQIIVSDTLFLNIAQNTTLYVSAWQAGCESEKVAIEIIAKPLPNPTLPPAEIRIGKNVPFTLEANGGVTYQWRPSENLSNPNSAVTQAIVTENTTFQVTITNAEGCSVVRSVQVIVDDSEKDFFLPTLFSPNNDGIHDYLKIMGKNIAEIEWSIYDRNGKLLYRTRSVWEAMNIGWDGTFQGVPQPQEMYIWTIQGKFSDGSTIPQKAGSFLLLR